MILELFTSTYKSHSIVKISTFNTPVRFGSGMSFINIPFSMASSCTNDATVSSTQQTIYAMEEGNHHNLLCHSFFNDWGTTYTK